MSSGIEPSRGSGAGGARAKRPVWVWVITIYYALSVGFVLVSFALLLSGAVRLPPAQQEYFAQLGLVDYVLSIGVGLMTLTATVLLFLLKKGAAHWFTASLFLNVGLTLAHAATTSWAQAVGGSGLIGTFSGWGILVAVALYSRRLRQLHVLS